jgi:ribosomal protein S25
MGGKGKKGIASLEKQQARQIQEQQQKKREEKKKAKKEDRSQQKTIYVVNEAAQELLNQVKPNSYYTLYELASKINAPLSLTRRAVRQLEAMGKLHQISKSGNSRLFAAA